MSRKMEACYCNDNCNNTYVMIRQPYAEAAVAVVTISVAAGAIIAVAAVATPVPYNPPYLHWRLQV